MKKLKASFVLEEAKALIERGEQRFVCAAILDVETTIRWNSGEDVKSNALKIFQQLKPKEVHESVRNIQSWWPVGDKLRIEAINKAILMAKKAND